MTFLNSKIFYLFSKMALISTNAGYYNDNQPTPYIKVEDSPIIKGSLLNLLDSRFSIFVELARRGGFRDLLNDPQGRHTVFAFPDQYLSEQTKSALLSLDVGESFSLIGSHIINGVNKMSFLMDNRFLIPTKNKYNQLFVDVQNGVIGLSAETFQKVKLLNNGDLAINGVVVVIMSPLIPQSSFI